MNTIEKGLKVEPAPNQARLRLRTSGPSCSAACVLYFYA